MELIQTSSNLAPRTKTVYRESKFPIACIINPNLCVSLPQTSFPGQQILRCMFCKGFINLYSDVNTKEYN